MTSIYSDARVEASFGIETTHSLPFSVSRRRFLVSFITMSVVYTRSGAHAASLVTCAPPESGSSSSSSREERLWTRESLQIPVWRPWVLVCWSHKVWSRRMARGAGALTCGGRGDTSAHEETAFRGPESHVAAAPTDAQVPRSRVSTRGCSRHPWHTLCFGYASGSPAVERGTPDCSCHPWHTLCLQRIRVTSA